MDLIACPPPAVALESAPVTALRRDSATERWEGFWGDDTYFVRVTRLDSGAVEWFRLADTAHDDVSIARSASPAPSPAPPTPVRDRRQGHGVRGLILASGRGRMSPPAMVWMRRRKSG